VTELRLRLGQDSDRRQLHCKYLPRSHPRYAPFTAAAVTVRGAMQGGKSPYQNSASQIGLISNYYSSMGFHRGQVPRAASDWYRLCLRHRFKRCFMVVPLEGSSNGSRHMAGGR
jgi:hypothetical protein